MFSVRLRAINKPTAAREGGTAALQIDETALPRVDAKSPFVGAAVGLGGAAARSAFDVNTHTHTHTRAARVFACRSRLDRWPWCVPRSESHIRDSCQGKAVGFESEQTPSPGPHRRRLPGDLLNINLFYKSQITGGTAC